MKICKKCSRELCLTEFDKSKANKDGYQGSCKDCVKAYQAEYRKKNKEKLAKYGRNYRKANKEVLYSKAKEYNKLNRDKVNAYNAKRRASRIQATPVWGQEGIEDFYLAAQMFKTYTGENYHVDHIIPLQNEKVCGLHVVENLQVLHWKDNNNKSNIWKD